MIKFMCLEVNVFRDETGGSFELEDPMIGILLFQLSRKVFIQRPSIRLVIALAVLPAVSGPDLETVEVVRQL
jgi:hypothetical protein